MSTSSTARISESTVPCIRAIAIGASAGALDALSIILPALPAGFPIPVLVVVHLPADKESLLANLLDAKCQMDVREAADKEPIQFGTIYLAPPAYHMLVENDQSLSLSADEPVNFSRPSIDVLFETAADAYGSSLVGVILTGANNDGAYGLRTVVERGGIALVQRPDQSYASAMPLAALSACPQAQSLSLNEISDYLSSLAKTE
ncbi:MAG TPA: chemotaxis protein CheB [Pirellulales bacterium]